MSWYRFSDRKAAPDSLQNKASLALSLLSLILAGLAGCRNPAAKHVSEPFVSTCTVTPALLRANTCINFVKGPQSKCFLRLHGYTASDEVLKGAELELGSWTGRDTINQDHMKKMLEGGLKPIEMESLNYYTSIGYRPMNKALRGELEGFGAVKHTIYSAASALNKLKAFDGEVYRTENVEMSMLDSIQQTFKVGNLVIEEAFLSTSKRANLNFATPGDNLHISYRIQSKTARDLELVPRYPNEAEVLFFPGSVFRVLSFEETTGIRPSYDFDGPVYGTILKIEMEEVDLAQ